MELSDDILIELCYVEMSAYRARVMKSLEGDVKIPSQIAKDSDIIPNHLSKVLKQLTEHELIECVNPQAKKGRLYRLTDKGDLVAKNLSIILI